MATALEQLTRDLGARLALAPASPRIEAFHDRARDVLVVTVTSTAMGAGDWFATIETRQVRIDPSTGAFVVTGSVRTDGNVAEPSDRVLATVRLGTIAEVLAHLRRELSLDA